MGASPLSMPTDQAEIQRRLNFATHLAAAFKIDIAQIHSTPPTSTPGAGKGTLTYFVVEGVPISQPLTERVNRANSKDSTSCAAPCTAKKAFTSCTVIVSYGLAVFFGLEYVLRLTPNTDVFAKDSPYRTGRSGREGDLAVTADRQSALSFRDGDILLTDEITSVFSSFYLMQSTPEAPQTHQELFLKGEGKQETAESTSTSSSSSSKKRKHSNGWPNKFVAVYMLQPAENKVTTGIQIRRLTELLRKSNPDLVSCPTRNSFLWEPEMKEKLREIRNTTPVKHVVEKLSLEVLVRECKLGNGNVRKTLDIIISPRDLAPAMFPLDEMASLAARDVVPPGSFVRILSEKGGACITFKVHVGDVSEDGKTCSATASEVSMGRGFWTLDNVQFLQYQKGGKGEGKPVKITDESRLKELLSISETELWETKSMIRHVEVTVYANRKLYAQMLGDVRTGAGYKIGSDWDSKPMVLKWPNYFELGPMLDEHGTQPLPLRLIGISINYFEEGTPKINPDGSFDQSHLDDDKDDDGDGDD
eukprot:jgi/Bigna1/75775/fgenesh1_pg.37_\